MENSILEHEIKSFMAFLEEIQSRVDDKYGLNTIKRWRQKRLARRG